MVPEIVGAPATERCRRPGPTALPTGPAGGCLRNGGEGFDVVTQLHRPGRVSEPGVSTAWLDAFDTTLRYAAEADADFGGRRAAAVRGYVLDGRSDGAAERAAECASERAAGRAGDGEPGGLPAGLGGMAELCWLAATLSSGPAMRRAAPQLYAELPQVRPDVALRWLHVQAVAWPPDPGELSMRFPGEAAWPYVLMRGCTWVLECIDVPPFWAQLVEALQVAAGWDPATVLVAALTCPDLGFGDQGLARAVLVRPDIGAELLRHADAVHAAFGPVVGREGLFLARVLARVEPDVAAAFPREVAALLSSGAKKVRTMVAPLIRGPLLAGPGPGPVLDALWDAATPAAPRAGRRSAHRARALTALRDVGVARRDAELIARVTATAAADGAADVRRLARDWTLVDDAVARFSLR